MRLKTLQIVTLSTGALALAIAALAIDFIQQPPLDITSRIVPKWTPPTDEANAQGDTSPITVDLGPLIERPLFLPERRPFQPSLPAPEPTPALGPVVIEAPTPPVISEIPVPLPQAAPLYATLKGVLMTGSLDKAYLATPEAPDGAWFTVGIEISGWKLVNIKKNQVTLALGEQKQVLQLYVDNPAKPVGNVAPPN